MKETDSTDDGFRGRSRVLVLMKELVALPGSYCCFEWMNGEGWL
jgi:hypothetical protein